MAKGYVTSAWLVLLLALIFGAGLAGMELTVADRIAANKLAETLSQIPRLVPGAEKGEAYDLDGRTVYRAVAGDETIGWVVPAKATGFADLVEILVGVDAPVETITGVYVLAQKETPGLGANIASDTWRAQFAGKATDVVNAGYEKGIIVASAGEDVVRLLPPLVITTEHIDEVAARLDEIFTEM